MPHDIATIRSAGGFQIIMADAAWRYKNAGGRGAAEQHYKPDDETGRSTMSLEEICAMPVDQIAAKDSALFMWGTWPLLPDCLKAITAWGFEYKTMGFLWVKYYETLVPFFGMGHFTRGNTEPCFLAVKGKPKVTNHGVSQLIEDLFTPENEVLTAPVDRKHSRKPWAARAKIDQLFGPDPLRVELFARDTVPGWDCWGNEVDSTITFK